MRPPGNLAGHLCVGIMDRYVQPEIDHHYVKAKTKAQLRRDRNEQNHRSVIDECPTQSR
jgi:hypothetical protein